MADFKLTNGVLLSMEPGRDAQYVYSHHVDIIHI